MKKLYVQKITFLLLTILPAVAFAHSESSGNGFISGLAHPIFGLDHLLAMLGVGIVSAQYGGRLIWLVPALFVAFMVIGGILGANGIGLPFVELGIALSVLVLGICIMLANNQRFMSWLVPTTIAFVIVFGSLHGHAHGVEMPGSANPVFYSFGFIVSTSLIHLVGVLIGHFLSNYEGFKKFSTILGALFASAGCFILVNL
jgi:urease accessory protein